MKEALVQPSLFDFQPTARYGDPATSHQAAEKAAPRAKTNREIALRILKESPGGLTDFELSARSGIAQTSIGVRRGELVKQGLVRATKKRRPSPSGSPSIVWEAL